MPAGFLAERRFALPVSLLGMACLAWSVFVDLRTTPLEAAAVLAGLALLWLPIGGVAYVLLRDRCTDGLTRLTLAAATGYALTAPLYALFGLCALAVPWFQQLFYVAQALMLAGLGVHAVRHKRVWRLADVPRGWRRLNWTLILLIASSMLATHRYKAVYALLPDGNSRRLVAHPEATYLAAIAYELGRQTPAAQQPVRAGIQAPAYPAFPHLTTMLIARYTGQSDILRALLHTQFTVVEVLSCLTFFCMARQLTASNAAGYLALSSIYIFAIPLGRFMPGDLGYCYFTWHPQATSSLEPALYCLPQTYCALPVVFGTLLFVLQLSAQIVRQRAAAALAVLSGLMAAVLAGFCAASFLIFFPGLLSLLAIGWRRTGQRGLLAAGLLAMLVVAVQVLEMRSSRYYPDAANLVLGDNHLAHRALFLNAWPGSREVYWALWDRLSAAAFSQTWQVVCLTMFGIANMIGIPVAIASGVHFLRPRTWRGEARGLSAMLAWLTVGTLLASMYLGTSYDACSLGEQSLFMLGWYLLPLLAIDLCHSGQWISRYLPAAKGFTMPVAALLVLAACGWQRVRPASDLQAITSSGGSVLSADEFAAIETMRTRLPADAVLLTKAGHHGTHYATLSGTAGRRVFLEYQGTNLAFQGGPADQDDGRLTRIDRVWNAADPGEFMAAALDTGASHLVEYARWPLACHPSDCLEEFWCSQTGQVKLWTFRGHASAEPAARIARQSSAANHDHASSL